MAGHRIVLNSNEIEISAFYFKPELKKNKYPAIIIAHGIPSTPLPVEEKGYDILAKELNQIDNKSFISIIFNFRGCRGSDGLYSPLGWVQDLHTVVVFLKSLPEVDKDRIILLSFSAGAMVSVYFASQTPAIKALICSACPSDLSLKSPLLKRLTVSIKFAHNSKMFRAENTKKIHKELNFINPLKWVDKIFPRPLLIIHGEKDELINIINAYKLFERAKDPKELKILKGVG